MKKQSHLINLVTASLFAALCCSATFIKLAITPTGGYVNLGDVVVILSAFLLSPIYAALASGIGSMLADILMAYPQYAPGTLTIKAMMALFAGLVLFAAKKISSKNNFFSIIFIVIAGICAEAIMIGGYFVFEAYILRYGVAGALMSVIPNVFQGIAGIVGGTVLCLIVKRIKVKE